MFKELLPIGSVVLLQDGTKKLMIMGIKPVLNEKIYDYIGVLYPEGFIGSDKGNFLFNHSDINDIAFVGYSNPEREKYFDALEEANLLSEKNENGN